MIYDRCTTSLFTRHIDHLQDGTRIRNTACKDASTRAGVSYCTSRQCLRVLPVARSSPLIPLDVWALLYDHISDPPAAGNLSYVQVMVCMKERLIALTMLYEGRRTVNRLGRKVLDRKGRMGRTCTITRHLRWLEDDTRSTELMTALACMGLRCDSM